MRKDFVKEFVTCYTELSRLPYFNLVKQIVVDPMHNLFLGEQRFVPVMNTWSWSLLLLGLVKAHFYNIWVQEKILCATHELRVFHQMLFEVCEGFLMSFSSHPKLLFLPQFHSSLFLQLAGNFPLISACHLVDP